MDGLLGGKRVLLTGGSRGIGKAMVEAFVAQGARVLFTYRSSAETAKALEQRLGGPSVAMAIQSDASSYAQAEELVRLAVKEMGGIDVLVNNAGITKDALLLRMSEEQWDAVIQTNLKSVFNLTRHAVRPMMKQREGVIINISSVVGLFGNAGQANYAASKAGIIGFTKSVAKELGSRNVRCNAIAPGFVQTEMTEQLPKETIDQFLNNVPLRRFATPDEIADVAVFLASDMARLYHRSGHFCLRRVVHGINKHSREHDERQTHRLCSCPVKAYDVCPSGQRGDRYGYSVGRIGHAALLKNLAVKIANSKVKDI